MRRRISISKCVPTFQNPVPSLFIRRTANLSVGSYLIGLPIWEQLHKPVMQGNNNFWQAIRVFMFQGECVNNLNNLFSKPSTPILTWTNPRQSFLRNYDYMSHLTYDNLSFHFLDLHLPSSASVGQFELILVPC